MAVRSAAILLHRRGEAGREVWIAHMGGPFWARKDEGAWTLPKGLVEEDDVDELAAARREFAEEMGTPSPDAVYLPLGEFRASSKTFVVFAAEADFGPIELASNEFELEWPPRSGVFRTFPEVDDAGWHPVERARTKLAKGQRPILDALLRRLGESGSD
ncbi:NUDIX domain-containing protein [Leifsonia shinshuensis]|uniref:NUDIX domain-containing protein n=1 Tax=Leifsonia shinshuensis TaxID=150026 RepID=A0A7G6Y717_9MICO|nr:NUDIX domain-containing protein [Leifsonia shinshuensis]QNE34282.1 NUDIX domain-containing protein [Leifsonia shinshuensis]